MPVSPVAYRLRMGQTSVTAAADFSARVQAAYVAHIATLEGDAGRYRWLRENQHPQVMHPSCYGMGNAMREHLDAAIDAALAARKGD